ncbi:DUF3040 domain-containing protein [Arcanobacterium hippocoleae]
MALSDYERQMLADLESQLNGEDVRFTETLAAESGAPMRWAVSAKNLIFGLIMAVVGLAVVMGGVALEIVPVGVLGVIVVFAGFWYISAGIVKKPGGGGSLHLNSKPKGGGQGDFMQRQAEEWLKRMREGNRH